jgi:hypothetical protein
MITRGCGVIMRMTWSTLTGFTCPDLDLLGLADIVADICKSDVPLEVSRCSIADGL